MNLVYTNILYRDVCISSNPNAFEQASPEMPPQPQQSASEKSKECPLQALALHSSNPKPARVPHHQTPMQVHNLYPNYIFLTSWLLLRLRVHLARLLPPPVVRQVVG